MQRTEYNYDVKTQRQQLQSRSVRQGCQFGMETEGKVKSHILEEMGCTARSTVVDLLS